jgi:hypothetical protein
MKVEFRILYSSDFSQRASLDRSLLVAGGLQAAWGVLWDNGAVVGFYFAAKLMAILITSRIGDHV